MSDESVKSLLPEIAASHSALEWRPIETAPKDGTAMIFYIPIDMDCGLYEIKTAGIGPHHTTYNWNSDMNMWITPLYKAGLQFGNEPAICAPTHWILLPRFSSENE